MGQVFGYLNTTSQPSSSQNELLQVWHLAPFKFSRIHVQACMHVRNNSTFNLCKHLTDLRWLYTKQPLVTICRVCNICSASCATSIRQAGSIMTSQQSVISHKRASRQ